MSGLVQKVLDNEMGDEVLHVYHPPTPLFFSSMAQRSLTCASGSNFKEN